MYFSFHETLLKNYEAIHERMTIYSLDFLRYKKGFATEYMIYNYFNEMHDITKLKV